MEDGVVYILLIVGLPLLGFIYYLEHKKRMYLLERYGQRDESAVFALQKKLIRGLFLSLSGPAMILAPNIARMMGMEAGITFEMLLCGAVVSCAGLAMVIGCGIMKVKDISSAPQEPFELK